MPHESTVEHTGEMFEPTDGSAFAPRGFSFSDHMSVYRRGDHVSSTTNASSGSVLPRLPCRCNDDDDENANGKNEAQEPIQRVPQQTAEP